MTTTDMPTPPRAMLAAVALADLPTPADIRFSKPILALTFDAIAQGQAWSRHLSGCTDTRVYPGGVYLNEGRITWRGWSVHLLAWEDAPRPPASLPADTRARLAQVASADPGGGFTCMT
ncbi:MAG: hypothetical protein HKP61_21930 [Dactylosporangium sp.]|nr:hypothetical protein [Dactylosporangium sp.]NNJ63540.1 hypothetical protein [Dactylosporangium sp.]